MEPPELEKLVKLVTRHVPADPKSLRIDRCLTGKFNTTCPKYLADRLEVGDIPFLGAACDLVEPADRVRLQTRFGWISRGINDLDLNLDGISTPTHPALPLFPPFLHLANP